MERKTPVRIPDVAALIYELKDDNEENDPKEFFILLAGGITSTKSIQLREGKTTRFNIVHEIDDTEQTLTEGQLFNNSNIGMAMRAGNFYAR